MKIKNLKNQMEVIEMEITNAQIKKILKLTASLDPDGSIWGYDTEVYTSFEDYVKDVRRILKCQRK